ncbi:ankyrin repeat domain-containing protein [Nocardia colli]|uniref:ankyrin repeat domain-containing protein n=1 Tax=Nocardia colli TaxID=2545717 RepID=UPI0035DD939E
MNAAFPDPVAGQIAAAIARREHSRVCQLLTGGADSDAVGADGISLLEWAIVNSSIGSVRALIDAGADLAHADEAGDAALHYAAIADDHRCLGLLLAQDLDVDVPNPRTGHTPLMDAVLYRRHPQVSMLLAAGADPDAVDRAGDTPLHMAGEIDDYESVLDLLEAGADPRRKNRQGATFQHYIFMTPAALLTTAARSELDQVIAWLDGHDIPVEHSSAGLR